MTRRGRYRPVLERDQRRRSAGIQGWNSGAAQLPPGCPDPMHLIDCARECIPAIETHAVLCPFCGGRLAMYRRMLA